MPVDLSMRGRRDTGRFYSRIHETILAHPETAPSHIEFVRWLRETFTRPGDIRVLDAGCGAHALNARSCIKHGFGEVDAIDLNDDAVRAGTDIGVRAGSILDLPYETELFDLVVCSGVAHHTPDPPRAFRELFRVTRSGGVAYISLYTFRRSAFDLAVRAARLGARIIPFDWMHRVFRGVPAVNNFALDHMYVPMLWLYTAAEARQELQRAGFIVQDDWPSSLDPFARSPLGRPISGDSLLRVFVCRRP